MTRREHRRRRRGVRPPGRPRTGTHATLLHEGRKRQGRQTIERDLFHDSWESGIAFSAGLVVPVVLAFNGGGLDTAVNQQASAGLWWFLAIAVVFGLLPRGEIRALRLPLLALGGLVAWMVLSMGWTQSDERTYVEIGRTLGYAGLVLLVALGVHAQNWRAAGSGVLTALLALPLVALASRLAPDAFAPTFALEFDRLAYPLEYWNALAAWSAMAACAGVALSAHHKSRAIRAGCLAAATYSLVVIYLTYSRGGFAALAAGLVALLLLSHHRWLALMNASTAVAAATGVVLVVRGQPEIVDGTGGEGGGFVALALVAAAALSAAVARWSGGPRGRTLRLPRRATRAAGGLGLAAALIGAIVFGPSVSGAARDQFTSPGYIAIEDDPASRLTSLEGSRDEIWASAARAFGDEPVLGIGPGSFDLWYERDIQGGEAVRDAHSLYLETLAEAGVPGFLFLLLALVGLALPGVRAIARCRSTSEKGLLLGLVSAWIVFCAHAAIDWLWESTAVMVVGLLGAAIAAASVARGHTRSGRMSWRSIGLTAACVAAGALYVPSIVATERMRASVDALLLGNPKEALESAEDAVSAEPWAAAPYAVRAAALTDLSRFSQAARDARRASAQEPTNWRHPAQLATILEAAGKDQAAARALKQAIRLRTTRP